MGKKRAPSADPRIGDAAMKSAELGEQYLKFMREQADKANNWADEDRARYKSVYQPVEDKYIADAANYASPERKAAMAAEAVADVRQNSALARGQGERRLAAVGVNPASGRAVETVRRDDASEALAAAGAENLARRQVEATADGMTANVINMGKGMAVNPATSLGLANQAAASGTSGAMGGYGQQGDLLNAQWKQRMTGWEAKQGVMGEIGGALGNIAGLFMSAKDSKENKRPVFGILDAVKAMPVEKWSYKKGMGDGGEHIGPYAEDFKAKTGLGNGREISVIDALGVSMGAIKELAARVDEIGKIKGKAA
jgi:hypothetical protein